MSAANTLSYAVRLRMMPYDVISGRCINVPASGNRHCDCRTAGFDVIVGRCGRRVVRMSATTPPCACDCNESLFIPECFHVA